MVASVNNGRRFAGFLAIPAFFTLLALTGFALSTESREDFEERTEEQRPEQSGNTPDQQAGQDQPSDQGQQSDQGSPQQADGSGQDQGQSSQSQQQGQGQGDGQGSSEGRRQPVVIQTENGEIVVELDENGDPIGVVPGDALVPTDPSRVLTPSEDGEFVGFRIDEDGGIEPVERGDFQSGDYLLGPARGDGIDIIRPDGTRVQLRPQSDGELSGSQINGDGTITDIQPDSGDIVIQPGSDLPPNAGSAPGAQPLVIETDRGPVRVDIAANGDLVADQPTGEMVAIDPDDLSAIRVDEDGSIELVPLDEVGPDDTLLVPADGGFDLVRPDGSRVEFRPDGENDGTTATEITADGQETELVPNPDGSVTLSDGTTVGPIDIAEDGGTFEQIVDRASDLPWPWVFGGIALLALLSIGTAFYLHRNRPDDQFDYSQFVTAGVPEDQFENFLALLLADTDATRAIRLGFYAAERGLGGLPPRRAEETPFEWHARVEHRRPELAHPLGPICDMFARVRFGSEAPTLADRDLMVEHLRELNAVANAASGGGGSAAGHNLAGV